MAWSESSAKALKELAGAYELPGGCWAVLTINPSPPKNAEEAAKYPEGYGYTWAVLAPGIPPNLRGHRIAGVDNTDDKHVRDQVKSNPQGPRHRAHRHFPDWKEVKTIRGQEWPVAGPGIQLDAPPATPHDFWLCCMNCLEHVLSELGLDMPNEEQLLAGHMLEKDFRQMQQSLRPGKPPGLAR
jgi:hypothetical protein